MGDPGAGTRSGSGLPGTYHAPVSHFWLRTGLPFALIALPLAIAGPARAVDRGAEPQPRIASAYDARQEPTGPVELLVRYRRAGHPDFDTADQVGLRAELNQRAGAVAVREVASSAIEVVRVDDPNRVDATLRTYRADPAVSSAERNATWSTQVLPDDRHFDKQWALRNTGQADGTADADIDAPEAWRITQGSREVVVVVIDTGVAFRHPDLAANIWTNPGEVPGDGKDNDHNGYVDDVHGWDALDNDGNPRDLNGHGTHVAGTIGAQGDNTIGIAGVAWRVRIAACRFLDANGDGSTDGAIACLDYVKALRSAGVNVVATNNSWSGGDRSALLRQAINNQQRVLFVAAAGNNGDDIDGFPTYPASYQLPSVLAVAATDRTDHQSGFSNWGATTVGISAPGSDIISLRAPRTDLNLDGGATFVPPGDPHAKYSLASGTSMAAPHVTGVVALLKARFPELDAWGVRNRILAGGDRLPWLEGSTITGRRLNADGALRCSGERILAPVGPQPTFPLQAGAPVTMRVLNIDCATGAGPVTATTSTNEVVRLRDDGRAPDRAAQDGIYAVRFTPTDEVTSLDIVSGQVATALPDVTFSRYLPEAQVGTPYSHVVKPFEATAPLQWSVVDGDLPQGVALDPASGTLSGTPTAAGHFPISLRLEDDRGRSRVTRTSLEVMTDSITERLLTHDRADVTVVPEAQAVDADGNTIVTGYYTDPRTLDEDVAVTKYSPSGDVVWRELRTSTTPWWANRGFAVAVDAAGNSYVASGYPYFRQDSDFVVVKYDPDGHEVWSSSYSNGEVETPLGISVDDAGNVVVTGMSDGFVDGTSALTVKLHADGTLAWARTVHVGLFDRGSAVGTDAAGNIYVAGGTGFQTDPSAFISYTYLVLKYSPAGDLVWSRYEHDPDTTHLQIADAIVVRPDGTTYVGGPLGGQLRKMDVDGNTVWELPPTTEQSMEISDLAIDSDGDVVVAGWFFDGSEQQRTGALATVTIDGEPVWLRRLGGDSDNAKTLADVDPRGVIRVTRISDGGTVLTSFRSSLRIRTSTLPDALRDEPYEQRLRATGGARPLTWTVTAGDLPAGLSLDPATGTVSGTPTAGGTATFTVTATADDGATASKELTLAVQHVIVDGNPGPLVLEVGQPWELSYLTARGPAPPFAWAVVTGELPPGVTVAPNTGVVSGTPTQAGTYAATIAATDADGHSGTTTLSIAVVDPLAIVTDTLPDGVVGQSYLVPLEATGGQPPYAWGWYGNPVPGLQVDNQTGILSGVPEAPGTYETGVFVSDSRPGVFTTRAFTLVVK